jgi:hypothetical protein
MMSAQLQQPDPALPALSTLAIGTTSEQGGGTTHDNPGEKKSKSEAGELISSPMANRAGSSNSPYIRAHADSNIKWQLLDDQAIERAKKENKLIFLNVGFRACHCEYFPT